jgi:CRISPR-associated protein Cas1
MIKRTIEISRQPLHLAVKLDQFQLWRHAPESGLVASIPCEDIGFVVVDNPGTTYSHDTLARLIHFGAIVVICNDKHLPSGLLLPLSDHTEVVWRLHEQIALRKPVRKQLWRQIVVAKIRAQAANLPEDSPARHRLLALAREVKSGDVTNVEAQAAKLYWSAWLCPETPFHRDPDSTEGINAMLNYGYAVIRAAVARALVSAGLHPALGLHHRNRGNAFCLADDMFEPLRPLVERAVRDLNRAGQTVLDPAGKRELLSLLTATVRVGDQTGPLMVGLHRTMASLVRCIQGQEKRLLLPIFVETKMACEPEETCT